VLVAAIPHRAHAVTGPGTNWGEVAAIATCVLAVFAMFAFGVARRQYKGNQWDRLSAQARQVSLRRVAGARSQPRADGGP